MGLRSIFGNGTLSILMSLIFPGGGVGPDPFSRSGHAICYKFRSITKNYHPKPTLDYKKTVYSCTIFIILIHCTKITRECGVNICGRGGVPKHLWFFEVEKSLFILSIHLFLKDLSVIENMKVFRELQTTYVNGFFF